MQLSLHFVHRKIKEYLKSMNGLNRNHLQHITGKGTGIFNICSNRISINSTRNSTVTPCKHQQFKGAVSRSICSKPFKSAGNEMNQENIKGTERESWGVGRECEFHQSYFWRRKSVSSDVRITSVVNTVKQSMALRVEARFTDKSDFVNKRKDFIAKDNPVWEIDSAISLDFADSLDNILDFEGELKFADSDSVSKISSSSATIDI